MSNPKLVALEDSIAEAERFVRRAKEARKSFREYKGWQGGMYWSYDGVPFAGAKRASMDLTRSLARLRRA